jgi:hypothetical protein
MPRTSLTRAVRERMRRRTASDAAVAAAAPRPAPPVPRKRPAPPDLHLEQLIAEAQYHRNRYELARARVVSASPRATTPGRLQALERSAIAAEERLAHARRGAREAD